MAAAASPQRTRRGSAKRGGQLTLRLRRTLTAAHKLYLHARAALLDCRRRRPRRQHRRRAQAAREAPAILVAAAAALRRCAAPTAPDDAAAAMVAARAALERMAALLAAVAVAIAARDFAQRRLDDCAVLRVLGAPQRAIG